MRRAPRTALLACWATPLLAGCRPASTTPAEPALEALPADLDPLLAERLSAARAAVRSRPDAADAWGALGLVYHANFLPASAVPCYERAERTDPGDARWPYQRALALYDVGALEEARDALRAALALRPDEAAFHWHLGGVLLELGRMDEAEASCARAVALAPDEGAAWSGRGRVRLERGAAADALADLDHALALAPRDSWTHHLRATALRMLGREGEAAAEQALGEGGAPRWETPYDRERGQALVVTRGARRKVAQELYDAGRFDDAIRVLEALSPELSGDLPHQRFLGRAYLRAGRVQEGLAAFRGCVAQAPEDRGSLIGLAEAELRAGLDQEAGATLERTIALHPDYGAPLHFLGVLRERRGDAPGAIEAFRACLERDQRNAPTHLALGRLLLEQRAWREAAAAYEGALRAGVDDGDVWVGLARARQMQGDAEGARSALAEARGRPTSEPELRRKVENALRDARGAGGG